MKVVSASVPDWNREACGWAEWKPGRQLVRSIRSYQHWASRRGPIAHVMRRLAVVRYRFWIVATSCDIPLNAKLAGGLLMPHAIGVVVHPQAVVGPNCLLMHQTTLGAGGKLPGVPKLGGHVDVGCGAKVLGGVTIGDHAKIGANAVVLTDVPAYATAVGAPARIILRAPDQRLEAETDVLGQITPDDPKKPPRRGAAA